jgi:hypothetical protein
MTVNGSIGALLAAAALTIAGTRPGRPSLVTGSRSRVEDLERPRLFFEEQPSTMRALAEVAAELKRQELIDFPVFHPDPTMMRMKENLVLARVRVATEDLMVKKGLNKDLIRTLMFQSMVDYVFNGRQSFAIGPRLQEMFRQTNLPDRAEEWMLQVPYRAFTLALPSCKEQIWGTYDTLSTVKGVVVDLDYLPGHMAILIWAPLTPDQIIGHYAPHGLNPSKAIHKEIGGMGNDAYLTFSIRDAVTDPRGFEAYILDLLDQWGRVVQTHGWPAHAIEVTGKARVAILKIVLGAILYLQSERQDLTQDRLSVETKANRAELEDRLQRLKTPAKRRKIEEKLKSLPAGSIVTWLGRSIEEDDKLGPSVHDGPDGDRRTLRRHWVRGHWRRPARKHGPRVLRWIQPFLRGSGEEVSSRMYKIGEPDDDE